LSCTPFTVNLFLLQVSQTGKSFGSIESFLNSFAFVYKFYLIHNDVIDSSVQDVKKFLAKSCPHRRNQKNAFGSAEIRKVWDTIEADMGGIESLNKTELRTFVMAVFQHKTFCRFSDAAELKLSDVLFDMDYFKIHIRYSKNDQEGIGKDVVLTRNPYAVRNAHMLMCLYLQRVHPDPVEEVYLFPPLR